MIGCALLTMLDELDYAGELKSDSRLLNLGLVMSLYLHAASGMEDYGIDYGELDWRQNVIAYAKKADIGRENGMSAFPLYYNAYDAPEDEKKKISRGRWRWPSKVRNRYCT